MYYYFHCYRSRGGSQCMPYIPNYYNPRFNISQVIINKNLVQYIF